MKAAQESIMKHLRRGREDCVHGKGEPPIFVNIDMRDGSMINTWIDALQVGFLIVIGVFWHHFHEGL